MTRRAASVLAMLATAIFAVPAAADDALARRLAAFAALVRPETAQAARRTARERGEPACANGWWRTSPAAERLRIEAAIRDASVRYAVDARLVRAVIRHESNYDPRAVSHKGAQGLMQLMPATARALGVACPFDPRENVLGGTRYLRRLRDRLGTWPRAIAAYHAGPHRVETGRIPGITHRYVRNVVGSWSPRRLRWMDLD